MVSYPGRHPEPPDNGASLELPLLEIERIWVRCHRTRYGALHFGRSGAGRFDDPERSFGVLYVSEDASGAFIETFGRRVRFHVLVQSELNARALTRIAPSRPLRLVDLSGSGLARIGADARILTGDHEIAQRWSRAFWHHPSQPDGVYYRARHDPSRPCAALFDRAASDLHLADQHQFGTPDDDPLLADILDTYGFTVIDGES